MVPLRCSWSILDLLRRSPFPFQISAMTGCFRCVICFLSVPPLSYTELWSFFCFFLSFASSSAARGPQAFLGFLFSNSFSAIASPSRGKPSVTPPLFLFIIVSFFPSLFFFCGPPFSNVFFVFFRGLRRPIVRTSSPFLSYLWTITGFCCFPLFGPAFVLFTPPLS